MRCLKWIFTLFSIAVLCGRSPAQGRFGPPPPEPNPSDADVRLEPENGKTQFALNEEIRLDLVFTSRTPGFDVNTTDYGDLSEDVNVTPADGWFRWRGQSGHDYSSPTKLAGESIRVPVVLNAGIVFQKPGRYQVSVTTGRLRTPTRSLQRTTNPVEIEIVAPDEREESGLVHSLLNEIATGDYKTGQAAASQLALLQGDEAVRAKVQVLLDAKDYDCCSGAILDGLATSRNLQLQLDLLEAAWHDVQHAPDDTLHSALNETRAFLRKRTLSGWQMIVNPQTDPASKEAEKQAENDMNEIAATLGERSGENLRDTAYFLMWDKKLSAADQSNLRAIVTEELSRTDETEQEMLLQNRWDLLRDPAIIPALEAILTPQPRSGMALGRLIDIAPEAATPYAIGAICARTVMLKDVARLPQSVLPEVDSCLEQQLKSISSLKPGHLLDRQFPAELAARFGSAAMLPTMRELFAARTKDWNVQWDEAPFLAYFLRYSPKDAMPRIQSLASMQQDSMDRSNAFFEIDTIIGYRNGRIPEELNSWLREKVEKGPDAEADFAAGQLANFGAASDKALLQARLDRLHKDWANRKAELNDAPPKSAANAAMQLEVTLSIVLTREGKVWTVPPEDKTAIAQSCESAECRKFFHQ